MKRPVLIAIVILVAIATGLLFLVVNNYERQTMDQADLLNNAGTSQSPQSSLERNGDYVNYDAEELKNIENNKVLFFYAPWCPQCRAIEADIQAKGVPSGVTIVKVDYDSNQSLRQKYGVTLQTTFVLINEQGEEVKKYVAYDTPNLEAVEANIFSR